jgi:hypothetical protein
VRVATHDFPPMCRQVCAGSGQVVEDLGWRGACPVCRSDDYIELDDGASENGDPPVYRCEQCGEEWS